MRAKYPDAPSNAGFNYRMVTLVSMDDPGLVILPTHRLIHSYTKMDTTAVREIFIERVLDIDKKAVERKENIEYLRDPQMGYDAVDQGQADFLLLMNPTRMEQVQACTTAGEKMPQKSTDFYPKVISGLVALPVAAKERL
ncbi:MAG: hypothetical protein B6I34_02115 [Anaerolineaceae bacterium 4572_32.1]|nr:MAG: hypothetical protein B6I34_02115 [Anaerolineaceae bacterium 4572_32.1]